MPSFLRSLSNFVSEYGLSSGTAASLTFNVRPAKAEGAAQALPAMPLAQHLNRDFCLVTVFCTATVLLVLYPIARFLTRQWAFRREKLYGALEGDGVVYYYRQFRAGASILHNSPPQAEPDLQKPNAFTNETCNIYMAAFRKDFRIWYGRKYYIAPALLLTAVSAVAAWWSDETLRSWASNGVGPGNDLRALVASALGGAFIWIVSDELDRLRRRDFTSTDVYYYVFRLLLAIPFAWALSASSVEGKIFGLNAAIPLGFFLGAFPTKTLFTIARRIGSQQLKLGDDQDSGNLELEKLQSIGKTNAERFKDEGVSTISTLAYADPIDLTIRTNFDFSYVVDCVSQALAWIYFQDDCASLFELSLRGAYEIAYVVQTANNPSDLVKQAAAIQTIQAAAARLKIDPIAFRTSLDQIAEDPYTIFLINVWS